MKQKQRFPDNKNSASPPVDRRGHGGHGQTWHGRDVEKMLKVWVEGYKVIPCYPLGNVYITMENHQFLAG